jgi:hypothetical protein
MFSTFQQYVDEILAAGGREPRNLPVAGKLLRGVFVFLITIPDNATTEQDFTAQAALVSKNLIAQFGDSADAPFILWAEKMIVIMQEGTEASDDLRALVQSLYMAHSPARGNGTRYIDLAPYIRTISSAVAGAGGDTTRAQYYATSVPPVESWPEIAEGPLVVDMNRDTWVAAVETAVDLAAAVPALFMFEGWACPRFDDLGILYADCNGPSAAKTFRLKDMRARFIRQSLRSPTLQVMEKNNL